MKKKMLSSWEQEIVDQNSKRTIAVMLNGMEKSLVDNMNYDNKELIEKTGKEIKEKLQQEIQSLTEQKSTCLMNMTSLVESIGTLPLGVMENWRTKNFKRFLVDIPKMYTHEQIYSESLETNQNQGVVYDDAIVDSQSEESKKGSSLKDKMRSYNELANNFVESSIDILKMNTLIRNLQDSKKIKISIDLATQLGF